MEDTKKVKKILLLAAKVAIGSSMAMYIAQLLHLEYVASAGTITLLTLMTTKWETVRLSVMRLLTFVVTALIAWAAFLHIESTWAAYGAFIFLVFFLAEATGLRATISVNAVIGAHLLMSLDFTAASIWNEFVLVVIGVTIALILNLFHDNHNRKKDIIEDMRYTERTLQMIMGELAAYLSNKEMQRNVWEDIVKLEKQIQNFQLEAFEYQENTFHSHPGYYIDYFEMRQNQCQMLHNLHYKMKKIRMMPSQAMIIAEYMIYLMDFVVEINIPTEQIEKLESIFEHMKKEELPKSREEFENRALLYHILMDIEEFLMFKSRFVKSLDERQLKEYWQQ